MTLLELNDVSKIYSTKLSRIKVKALDEFNLKVEHGDFIAIMGPSGAGKTTVLNIASTIDTPSSGKIIFKGNEIPPDRKMDRFRRKNLGFVFQDHNLLDTLTIRENIGLPLIINSHKGGELQEKIETAADALGISKILDKFPFECSGGQRQRAAIARATAGDADLIIADEPTGALDSQNGIVLMESFVRLNRTRQSTILLVTHDPLIASFCSKVFFIKDGRNYAHIIKSPEAHRQELYTKIIAMLSSLERGTE